MIEDAIKVLMDALMEKGIRDDCIVLIGGGSHDEETAMALGADGYCLDASLAAETAPAVMAGR